LIERLRGRNHFGNNGSHCHCRLGASGLMAVADAMVSSGLRDAGWLYINMDGGWASHRDSSTGHLVPDSYQFPNGGSPPGPSRGSPLLVAGDRGLVSSAELLRAAGMKPVIDYIHSRGLRFGICKQPCRLFPVPGAGQQPRPLNGIIDCHAAPVL
jgi:hypothetical protein